MSDANTYQAVRVGDVAEWKLICQISANGLCAYLKNSNPTEEIKTLIETDWSCAPENLLAKIENTVYDHPQILDDFSSDIVIVAPRSIWVPAAEVEEDEERAAYLYNQVYSAEEDDIMSETAGDATCLYTLVPGLNAFLNRTFPGGRIHSHLAVMVTRFRERNSDLPRIYIDIRKGEADIIAFDRKKLLMAATHRWHELSDIQYHLYNIMDVYGLKPSEAEVSLSGLRDIKNELMRELRKKFSYVLLTMVPSLSSKTGMPLQAALLSGIRNL